MTQTKPRKKKKRRLRLRLPAALKTQPSAGKKKKKRRLRIKKEVLFVLAGALLIVLIALIPGQLEKNKLKALGYQKEEIKEIRSRHLAKTLLDNQWYSSYLASSIMDDSLNTDYMVYYTAVDGSDPLDAQDFLLISRLRDKGYEEDQIMELYRNLEYWEMTPLLVFDYQYNETLYIEDCKNHRSTNSPDHFALSQNYYTHYANTKAVDQPGSVDMLVNKSYQLDAGYVPADLIDLEDTYYSAESNRLSRVAAAALDEWGDAGRDVGVTFYATSAYRSYDQQEELYNIYVQTQGQEEADSLSARAGFSEHQTGLTVDIAATNEDDKEEFKDTNAYRWNRSNSQDYGWILRYPEGKEQITGYEFESWHYRYLGVELAQAVKASRLTYDEFYMLYLKPWDDETLKPSEEILKAVDYRKNAEPVTETEPSAEPES